MKRDPTRGRRKAWEKLRKASSTRKPEVYSISKGIKALIAIVVLAAVAASAYYFLGGRSSIGKEPVKAAVDGFFAEVKEGNLKEAEKYTAEGSSYNDLVAELGSGDYEEILKQVLSKIEYRIDDVEIEGAAATAQVHIESVDLFSFYNKHTKELNPMLEDYLSGTEAEKEKVIERFKGFLSKQLPEDIGSGDYDTAEGDVELNLVMKDGEWLILADDSLLYYLTGKMTLLLQ